MGDIDSTAVSGVEVRGYRRGAASTDGWDQYVVPVRDRIVSFDGRANTFRQLGIAGTAGQRLLSLHNATGSSVIVEIHKIFVDLMYTAAKLIQTPAIRIHKVTVLPTAGTALSKVAMDSALSSSSSVTLLQGTASEAGAATAITATIPSNSIVTQIWAPRALTLVGYEGVDRMELVDDIPITLRALEGIVVVLDYSVAGANPITDIWLAGVHWEEYTRP